MSTILITGAAGGLGRELARSFFDEGHGLVLVDSQEEALQETADWLGDGGARVRTACVDITGEEQIARMVTGLGDGPVDVLINNAGVQHVAPLEEFGAEHWDRLMAVMLRGTFLMTKAMIPRMRAQKFGRVVNIGSIHSLVASPYKSAYVAAKHGLLGLAKVAALETADADITVNTICPAYIRTPLVERQIKAQALAHGISEAEVIEKIMLAPMPKKTFITAEEVAAAVRFLISDAARNITGQVIVIDGGWSVQ